MNYKKTIKDFEREKPNKRMLSYMKKLFLSSAEEKEIEVYRTYTKEHSPIILTLTVVNPGKVGKEFFMTRGHVHKSGKEEFYILLDGAGKLILQKSGKARVVSLKKGALVLIRRGEAHRLVNTGSGKLKVLTIYHEDSKPNYSIKFKKRVFG